MASPTSPPSRDGLTKIRVVPLEQARACPFYVSDLDDRRVCFVKTGISASAAEAMVEDNPAFDPASWPLDCGGEWEACGILPLLYGEDSPAEAEILASEHDAPSEASMNTPTPEPIVPEPAVPDAPVSSDPEADSFDPFAADDGEDGLEIVIPEAPSETDEERDARLAEEARKNALKHKPNPKTLGARVLVQRTDNPYHVNADVLVYPTNLDLYVGDMEFLKLTNNRIQAACDQVLRERERNPKKRVRMGGVYATPIQGQVAPKLCYHAVVTGLNQVGEADIKKAMRNALTKAELDGHATVVMFPADCGLLDVGQAAMAQLQAIWEFLVMTDVQHVKKIGIVMRDQYTERIFKQYYWRVFEQNASDPPAAV